MSSYLIVNKLMPEFQSAYRPGQSTKTAVLKVFWDIIDTIDKGQLALLSLLDLSAAFDTVDHHSIRQQLQRSFGVDGIAIQWFDSYLTKRTQSVCLAGEMTASRKLVCGVPQGSVLGPLLFILYTADIGLLIRTHGLLYHCYADDTQICFFCQPTECGALKSKVIACISGIAGWMKSIGLQLNPSKSELVWCATTSRLHIADMTPFQLDRW